MHRPARFTVTCLLVACAGSLAAADDPAGDWIDLSALSSWRGQARGWSAIATARLDPDDPKRLAVAPGAGAICNGPIGGVPNIVSNEEFGDVAVRCDFFLPKGSNSGIKFQEVYEIQLFDSHGVKEPKGTDAGGVYPRSELKPKYHHIDGGHPPLVNAALPAGEWQTLEATFIAPRFDADGKKIADARITAVLNGRTVQDDLQVRTPTGSAHAKPEHPTGRLLLQGDHGPVAYRNIRARRLVAPGSRRDREEPATRRDKGAISGA